MTQTEVFEFKRCSRWTLACRLVKAFFNRQMTLQWEPDPVRIHEIQKPEGDRVEVIETPGGLDIRVSHEQ